MTNHTSPIRPARLVASAVAAVTLLACQPSRADLSASATSPDLMAPAAPASTTVPCQEDDPCWDCSTMGNGVCGQPPAEASATPAADPAGMFHVPCTEDATPVMVADPNDELPAGVWYVCVHDDVLADFAGHYLFDAETGDLSVDR